MKKLFLGAFFIVTTLFPSRAFAQLMVYDPAAFVQLLNTFQQGKEQLTQMGQMVGLNQQQLQTTKSIETAIGIAKGTIDPKALNPFNLGMITQGLGVDAAGYVQKAYQAAGPFAGALDVFMGTSLDTFKSQEGAVWTSFGLNAVNGAVNSLGISTGIDNQEIAFAQNVASMSSVERHQNRDQISVGLAALALNRYARSAEQRRVLMQTEANMANDAAKRAQASKTLNETASAQAEILAAQSRMQALQAVQQNQANETIINQASNANSLLQEMENRRKREAIEKALANQNSTNDF